MNLRKDHCRFRNHHRRTTVPRERRPRRAARGATPGARVPASSEQPFGRGERQGIEAERAAAPPGASAPRPGTRRRRGDPPPACESFRRLSATDISALASMKNVAKCDTWCELQNPVNHRVFERKLRPRPLGRGHACLGVTPPIATPPRHSHAAPGSGDWPSVPEPSARGRQKRRTPCGETRRVGVERRLVADRTSRPHSAARSVTRGTGLARSRGRSDRDPRSGVATR